MADSLFDNNNKNNMSFDEDKDYLTELTGPGGKYDRTKYGSETDMWKAMAKGKVHADRTLEFRNKEFDELRDNALTWKAEASAAAKFDEMFKKHMNKQQVEEKDEEDTTSQKSPQLSAADYEAIAERKYQEIENRRREASNMAELETRLQKQLGDNAKGILQQRMNTLGLTLDDVKFLARKSPEVALNSLGFVQQNKEIDQGLPLSNTRSNNFAPSGSGKRTASFYEKMKKENPKMYWNPETATQRMKDIDELGIDFDDINRRSSS